MLLKTALTALAALSASTALASPLAQVKRTTDDLEWISKNASLPKVIIYSTGGTILSASNYSRTDNINYGRGTPPTPQSLIEKIPELLDIAQLAIVPINASAGSAGLNSSVFLGIAKLANKDLCSAQSDISGALVFHGTNTLEETIFALDLTVNCSKPVIATGAMRPDTSLSADGPFNFYGAVAAAISPSSRDRGALIAFNDRIVSAYWAAKTNANTPDTFKALEQGFLGTFLGGQPFYYNTPSLPVGKHWFDISSVDELPQVTILYGHQGFDESLIDAAVANGAKGIVILGSGAGAISSGAAARSAAVMAKGIPVVVSIRSASGASPPSIYENGVIKSGYMNGVQSRIQLQLAVAAGYSMSEIRDVFEAPTREAIYNNDIYFK